MHASGHSSGKEPPSFRRTVPIVAADEVQAMYGQQEFRIYQDAIERLQRNEDQLPSLPTITLEIRKATSDLNISHQQLAAIISKDPSLTAILMKHASSAYYRTTDKPKNLQDVIARLGMRSVDSLVLAHSIKSLFILKDPQLKNLYQQAWRRQTLKACISYHLAKNLHLPNPDNALIASLLSEVGTLALLVALQNYDVPAEKTYRTLCKHYSKHLGAVLLAKWGLDRTFTDILRQTGQWRVRFGTGLQLIDVINLALFHTVNYLNPANDLMPIQDLAAFQKLAPPFNVMGKQRGLLLVEENMRDIETLASTFG